MAAPEGILETVLYARDIDAAEAFYRDVIGLAVFSKAPGRLVFLRCGGQMLLVFHPDHSRANDPKVGIPRHGADGPGHVCFRARDRADLEGWRARLVAAGVAIEHDHLWDNGARSIYVRDPAGNSVEFADPRLWART